MRHRTTWHEAAPINPTRIPAALQPSECIDVETIYVPKSNGSWKRQEESAYARSGKPQKRRTSAK